MKSCPRGAGRMRRELWNSLEIYQHDFQIYSHWKKKGKLLTSLHQTIKQRQNSEWEAHFAEHFLVDLRCDLRQKRPRYLPPTLLEPKWPPFQSSADLKFRGCCVSTIYWKDMLQNLEFELWKYLKMPSRLDRIPKILRIQEFFLGHIWVIFDEPRAWFAF